MKAENDAVSIEVENAMYFEVCKRSIEAMIVVILDPYPPQPGGPQGAGGYMYTED